MRRALILATLALLFSSSAVRANGVTVSTTSPGWVQIAPNTFVLPANLTTIGCGVENETSCEPIGMFNFNVGFAGPNFSDDFNISPFIFVVVDPNDHASDFVSIGNLNGKGAIALISDSSTPFPFSLPADGLLCAETDSGGCVGSFTIPTTSGQRH